MDVLLLQTLLWSDEIRPAILEGPEKEAKVRPPGERRPRSRTEKTPTLRR